MTRNSPITLKSQRWLNARVLAAILALTLLTAVVTQMAIAQQEEARVQLLAGVITGPGDIDVFRLPDLQAGDTLTVHMRTTSGDLDPLLMVVDGEVDLAQSIADYQTEVERLIDANGDIAGDVDLLRDRFSLAWDDDSGAGYAAAIEYEIPSTGTYHLVAGGALGAFGRNTSGEYELLVGINAPEVFTGTAVRTDHVIAVADVTSLPKASAVQEIGGTLASGQESVTFTLNPLESETTIYVYVEGISDGFRPTIVLRDFGGKPLAAGNLSQSESVATMQYFLAEGGINYAVEVAGANATGDQVDDTTFRMIIGSNSPDVLTGSAETQGPTLIQTPIIVQSGIRLNRISQVESKDEQFTMLGSIRMDWVDPAYAFSPDECNCTVRVYTGEDFRNFLSDVGSRWPDFSFFNQLGPRFSQNRAVAIWSDGRARYVEDFSTTIQADFDFKRFPFDTQVFPVYMDMLFAENNYVQEVLPDYSAISSDHGEDEFIITDFTTTISTETSGSTGSPVSRLTFAFSAPRHLDYYIFQIFVPILLIALISWFTFFLRDYTRRIEAAAGNVLLFIAFSFSLSDNYPRLGYLTFLDAIMVVTFVINTLVILYNVYLKQLESNGQGDRAQEIDRYLDWAYPVGYLVSIGIVAFIYFGRG